jgi:hypothetical protein
MTTTTAYFLDFELENRSNRDFTTCENSEIIEDFLKAAEVEYKPSKIRQAFNAIGKILLLLIAPAEFCRSLTEEEREKIGIEI